MVDFSGGNESASAPLTSKLLVVYVDTGVNYDTQVRPLNVIRAATYAAYRLQLVGKLFNLFLVRLLALVGLLQCKS